MEKDWKSYGGTAYYGCPGQFTAGKSALDEIRPKIFDPKSGQYLAPGIPAPAAGESITGGMCALSGTLDALRVVYLVTTLTQAPQAARTTAYLFDLKSGQPLAAKELQPPTIDLKFTDEKQWQLAATASGVAWLNAFTAGAFTDGQSPASPPRTALLSNSDLSMIWSDPQPGRVWQDVLAFQRNTEPGKTSGAELRQPTGESMYQENDIKSVDAELSDGPDKLVQITHWDSYGPPATSTMFYDLNARSIIKIGDTDRIPGGGLAATLSDGKLFMDGRNSDNSPFGFGVWNLRTHQWDLLKSRDDAKRLSISKLAFFDDHLYITNAGGGHSVIALPATNPVSSNWTVRPFERISGWTLVCHDETAAPAKGECREIVMVQDHDGHYPGPWF